MDLPVYVIAQLIILLLTGGLLSSIFVGLSKTLRRLKTPDNLREQRLHLTLTFILGWLLILAFLAIFNVLDNPSWMSSSFFLLFLIPSFVLIGLSFHPYLKQVLRFTDGRWLIRIQGFRIITELVLWLGYKSGFTPPQMTFQWLNYDIIVGLSALLGSQVFFIRAPRKPEIIVWNTFGIISILYWMIIATTSLPDPKWQLFQGKVDSSFLMEVPFIWLIGFIYPLAILMHVCSIRQLFLKPDKSKKTFKRLSERIKNI